MFFETVFFFKLLLQVLLPLIFQSLVETVLSHNVSVSRFSDVVDQGSDVPHGFSTHDYVFHDLSSVSNSRLSDFGRCASSGDCAVPDFSNSQSLVINHDSISS